MSNLHGLDEHITGNWGEDSIGADDASELRAHLVDDGTLAPVIVCDYCDNEAWYTCAICAEPICHAHSIHGDGNQTTWCTECEDRSVSNHVLSDWRAERERMVGDDDGGGDLR